MSAHLEGISESVDDELVGVDEALGEERSLGDASAADVAAAQVVVLTAARFSLQLGALRAAVANAQSIS